MSRQAQLWFDQGVFKGAGDLAALDGEEEDDDEGGGDKLDDEHETDAGAEIAGLTVHASEDIDGSMTESEHEGEH